jgi:hypothetical protein
VNAHRSLAVPLFLTLSLAAPASAGPVRPIGSAERKSMAELLPAHTLAYLELHDPRLLAQELRALLQGSLLEEPNRFLTVLRGQKGKQDGEELATFAALWGPEVLGEFGDWEGGALALTGFSCTNVPEIVAVLRPGRSRTAALAFRLLLANANARPAGRAEGTDLFVLDGDAEDEDELPTHGLFCAQVPGALVMGSTRGAVSAMLHRLRGKSTEPTLADRRAFREAADALSDRPGLFAWVDAPELARQIDEVIARQKRKAEGGKGKSGEKVIDLLDEEGIREWAVVKALLNPGGMHWLAAGCGLRRGEVNCRLEMRLKEGETCPLAGWSPDRPVSDEMLAAVPSGAFALLAVPVSDGAAVVRWLLQLADSAHAASGEDGPSPGKQAREDPVVSLALSLVEQTLARVRGVAIAPQIRKDKDDDIDFSAVLLVETADEKAALALQDLLKLLYLADSRGQKAKAAKVDGQTVWSMEEYKAASVGDLPHHFGRRGKVLVLGWRAAEVAAALKGRNPKTPLLGLTRAEETVRQEGAVSAIGLFSLRHLLREMLAFADRRHKEVDAEEMLIVRLLGEMSGPMVAMPPTLCALTRQDGRIRLEMRQAELRTASLTFIDTGLSLLGLMRGDIRGPAAPAWNVQPPAPVPAVPVPPAAPAPPF